MPPLTLFSSTKAVICIMFCAQLFSTKLQATEFEITPMFGQTFGSDLASSETTSSLSTTNEPNFAISFAWQDSPTGQGQILVNYISRDFTEDVNQSTHSFDTIYTHFNGVAFFKDGDYTTTVGLGFGATYFNSDFDNALYPSITAAVGTRYEFSSNFTFITELRAYATLTDNDDTLFCQSDNCMAQFDSTIWFDTQLSLGIAYRF